MTATILLGLLLAASPKAAEPVDPMALEIIGDGSCVEFFPRQIAEYFAFAPDYDDEDYDSPFGKKRIQKRWASGKAEIGRRLHCLEFPVHLSEYDFKKKQFNVNFTRFTECEFGTADECRKVNNKKLLAPFTIKMANEEEAESYYKANERLILRVQYKLTKAGYVQMPALEGGRIAQPTIWMDIKAIRLENTVGEILLSRGKWNED